MMKTILISLYQAVAVKNILRTPVITTLLADPDVRVVCLVRAEERIRYYEQAINHERLIFDAFYKRPPGAWERVFSFLKFSLIRTITTDMRRAMRRDQDRAYLSWLFGVILNRLVARRIMRRFIRTLDFSLVPDPGFKSIFQTYEPDVVVATNLFDDTEAALVREARKAGIPTVGFVNSWDRMTARWGIRILPDVMAVYNEIIKQEAMAHADMPEQKIRLCGIPQYDLHARLAPRPREDLCKKLGLDPKKAIVLLAPLGPSMSDSDWEVIDLLHELIPARVPNAQLLVRFQPNDFVESSGLKKRPWLVYDLPGIRYGSERGGDWDMTAEDLQRLTDTLAHSSIVVCYMSSIAVDAAILEKPVINIGFFVKPPSSPIKNPLLYYQSEHYAKALATGGIRMVSSPDELVEWLNIYLCDPSLDREARKRLVDEQCWKTDGKSGERLARIILSETN